MRRARTKENRPKFAAIIEAETRGEQIVGVCIGGFGGSHGGDDANAYDYAPRVPIANGNKNVVLTWEEARPLLDYRYYDGYGSADCHAVYVWTETRVFFVSQYDGSTRIHNVPRAPVACIPVMPGG